jgi:hypothetical protein
MIDEGSEYFACKITIHLLLNDFVTKNHDKFVINKDYYGVNTRQNVNLHMYQVNLAKYDEGVYHMAVKVFNGLPYNLKVNLTNTEKFKVKLKNFLYSNSFYSLEEFSNR